MRSLLLFLPLFALTACDKDEDDTGPTTATWECDEAHDGWERCTDEDAVEWCHDMEGSPHFHEGSDCAELGYACHEYGEGQAACVDENTTCSEGEAYCEENTAFFCVDGHLGVEPCSSVQECHEHDGGATCEDTVDFDPQQACDILADGPSEDKAVVTDFASVFSEDYHADLATAVRVILPDHQESYIHFPVEHSSEYVVFLDTTGVLAAVLDKEQTDTGAHSHGPNGSCPDDLVDHWHADLENETGGTVPFVLQFAAVDTQEITFIVMDKGVE